MSNAEEERERLALAIADGERIDWRRVAREGILASEVIAALRALEDARLPQTAPAGLAPGRVVGDFRLVERIGEGGMGQVWEAEQLSLGRRRIALKFLRPERVTERQREFFAREARAGGRLLHPGLVSVYGYGRSDGLAWIAMELVSGGRTLRTHLDAIARPEAVPAGHDLNIASIVADVAEAMQAAHEAGVIHRDLKPQNVLLTAEGNVKVTDFGLARILDESSLSLTGEVAGTCLYMSPEQIAGRRGGVDHRSDVFSLGVMLYECLTLRRPFEGDTSLQVLHNIQTKDPPDPRTIRSRVPADLAVIAGKALEKEPAQRYASMAELAADLRRFLAREPIRARPPTRLDRAGKWVRRNPAKGAAAAITLVALVTISGLLLQISRANRSLRDERSTLAQANLALEQKTAEARHNEEEARNQATLAGARFDEVVRLSALQRLEDLTREADALWPAAPERVEAYERWIASAEELVSERSEHESKLDELRARALPWTASEVEAWRAADPRRAEVARESRRAEYLRATRAALEAGPAPELALSPAAAGSAGARALAGRAWPKVDPQRTEWGREALGLALARRALALATPAEEPRIRAILAWALFANARIDEALAEAEQAIRGAEGDERAHLQGESGALERAIEDSTSLAGIEREARELEEAERRIAALEGELGGERPLRFASDQDRWWHGQLEKLVLGLQALADPERGLLSDGTSEEHGWGVRRRLAFASTVAERSQTGPHARAAWEQAVASIGDEHECPRYRGLRMRPQVGLLPIGRDPASGLWEFAHLQSGEPAPRGPDGRLELREETGLVFVLLPGGSFWMGAQSADPGGRNYCADSPPEEGPVHEVVLSPFFCSKYEMTQGQWLRVTGVNPSNLNARNWRTDLVRGKTWSLLNPVEQVNWKTSLRVARQLGLDLPSEAQWEYAARGGTGTPWWCGTDKTCLATAGNVADLYARDHGASGWGVFEAWDDGCAAHAPAGHTAPNPFGLHEIIGNVWEWCRDSFELGFYARSPRYDPLADSADARSSRVWRGGGFNERCGEARSGHRAGVSPDIAAYVLGLRPVRALDRPPPDSTD